MTMFNPIATERLLIRPFVPEDVPGLAARRSDPDVSKYQNWPQPYTIERASRLVEGLVAMDGPANDDWWMAVVADKVTGEVFGDLAVELTWEGRSAELGYNFDRRHWGKGYGTEAVNAFVGYLFESLGMTRVFGMLHPENVASAMILERAGMTFEGHTRSSYWDGDECSDDWIYGMTRPDWEDWTGRERGVPKQVRLVEITAANERVVSKLRTHKTQESFVAPMGWSFTDALFPEVVNGAPLVPWMRAIEADGAIVGFVMLALRTEQHPVPYLWRLLIDRMHQRRGMGSLVLGLVADELRSMGETALLTSWGEGKGSPRGFYTGNGFVVTGQIIDDETEARLDLV